MVDWEGAARSQREHPSGALLCDLSGELGLIQVAGIQRLAPHLAWNLGHLPHVPSSFFRRRRPAP